MKGYWVLLVNLGVVSARAPRLTRRRNVALLTMASHSSVFGSICDPKRYKIIGYDPLLK